MALRTLPFILIALVIGGCGSSGHSQSAPAPDAQPATGPAAVSAKAKPGPTVHFSGPTVLKAGSSFHATVKLAHFHIAPNMVGKAPVPGMGHLHFMLDGGKFDTPRYAGANGALAKKLGVAGAYSPAIQPQITYSHLPPGRYTLVCMLANNNHTPTGVEAKQTIIVR
jgi:hypothetical protein